MQGKWKHKTDVAFRNRFRPQTECNDQLYALLARNLTLLNESPHVRQKVVLAYRNLDERYMSRRARGERNRCSPYERRSSFSGSESLVSPWAECAAVFGGLPTPLTMLSNSPAIGLLDQSALLPSTESANVQSGLSIYAAPMPFSAPVNQAAIPDQLLSWQAEINPAATWLNLLQTLPDIGAPAWGRRCSQEDAE